MPSKTTCSRQKPKKDSPAQFSAAIRKTCEQLSGELHRFNDISSPSSSPEGQTRAEASRSLGQRQEGLFQRLKKLLDQLS